MKLTIVYIHYHTEQLLGSSIESVLASQFKQDVELEFIVVDNGSKGPLEDYIPDCEYKLLSPGTNLGYAGGINLALSHSQGGYYCVLNPDVFVEPECLARLLNEALSRKAIVGPRMFIDSSRRMILPCTEERSRYAEFMRVIGTRSKYLLRLARKRWREHQAPFRTAKAPMASYDLSGAAMLFSRDIYHTVGPFDERFRLYFEESDWLRRAKKSGVKAYHIPSAVAVHLYNQSASSQEHASRWMRESAQLFSTLHYGAIFQKIMAFFTAPPLNTESLLSESHDIGEINLSDISAHHFPLWLELVSFPQGYPGIVESIGISDQHLWRFSTEVWDSLATGTYILQIVSNSGKELKRMKIFKER